MKRKKTSDIRQCSKVGECVYPKRNSSMLSFRWRERGHQVLGNDETYASVFILREVVQRYHLHQAKRHIGCLSMMKRWRMLWWWEKFLYDLISMKRKWISVVDQWSNIVLWFHHNGNSSTISCRWREIVHGMLVNNQTLADLIIFREIVQWCHLDEEKTDIGCWSIVKHCRMCLS